MGPEGPLRAREAGSHARKRGQGPKVLEVQILAPRKLEKEETEEY